MEAWGCGLRAAEHHLPGDLLVRTEADLVRASVAAEEGLEACRTPGAVAASSPAQAGRVSTAGSLAMGRGHGVPEVAGAAALGRGEAAPGEADWVLVKPLVAAEVHVPSNHTG